MGSDCTSSWLFLTFYFRMKTGFDWPSCFREDVKAWTDRQKDHYANMSIQYAVILKGCKNENFEMKQNDCLFLYFARNINGGYTLEPPHSNEYHQSMF